MTGCWQRMASPLGTATTGCEHGERKTMSAFYTLSAQRNPSHRRTQRQIPTIQPALPPPRPRRRRAGRLSALLPVLLATLLLSLAPLASAVFVNFENCLDPGYRDSDNPKRLQFTPLHVWATFDTHAPNHHLNITIWGNVSGQAFAGPYPPPGDPGWSDEKNTFGKIDRKSVV